jgi:hypothetical protein
VLITAMIATEPATAPMLIHLLARSLASICCCSCDIVLGTELGAGSPPGPSHASHTSSSSAWCCFTYETSGSKRSGICDTITSGPLQSALDSYWRLAKFQLFQSKIVTVIYLRKKVFKTESRKLLLNAFEFVCISRRNGLIIIIIIILTTTTTRTRKSNRFRISQRMTCPE